MNMFSMIVTAAALLACAYQGVAQEPSKSPYRESVSIHASLPPFIFEIVGRKKYEITIRITGGPKNFHGQTITAYAEDENNPQWHYIDVNFDGYKDIQFVENRGATGNMGYGYWVFDPKACKFRQAPEFDNITDVDAEHKLLIICSKGGNIRTTTEYYRLQDGRPVIIKSVIVGWASELRLEKELRNIVPSAYPDDTPVQITRMYKNGKLYRTFYMQAQIQ